MTETMKKVLEVCGDDAVKGCAQRVLERQYSKSNVRVAGVSPPLISVLNLTSVSLSVQCGDCFNIFSLLFL